jgi:hypothetical protein
MWAICGSVGAAAWTGMAIASAAPAEIKRAKRFIGNPSRCCLREV